MSTIIAYVVVVGKRLQLYIFMLAVSTTFDNSSLNKRGQTGGGGGETFGNQSKALSLLSAAI